MDRNACIAVDTSFASLAARGRRLRRRYLSNCTTQSHSQAIYIDVDGTHKCRSCRMCADVIFPDFTENAMSKKSETRFLLLVLGQNQCLCVGRTTEKSASACVQCVSAAREWTDFSARITVRARNEEYIEIWISVRHTFPDRLCVTELIVLQLSPHPCDDFRLFVQSFPSEFEWFPLVRRVKVDFRRVNRVVANQ